MIRSLFLVIFVSGILIPKTALSQYFNNSELFEQTYIEITKMIDLDLVNFKKAVFHVENAYTNDTLDYDAFDSKIRSLAGLAYSFSNQMDLIYEGRDSSNIKILAGVWALMTDTLSINLGSGVSLVSKPYQYDFDDIFGKEAWDNMFVSKLLATRKGNCHSLPYLYKILVEELGEEAYLALAPNHIYIKQFSKKQAGTIPNLRVLVSQ